MRESNSNTSLRNGKKKGESMAEGLLWCLYKSTDGVRRERKIRKKKHRIKSQSDASTCVGLAIARQDKLDNILSATRVGDDELLESNRRMDGNHYLDCAPPNNASDFTGPKITCSSPPVSLPSSSFFSFTTILILITLVAFIAFVVPHARRLFKSPAHHLKTGS